MQALKLTVETMAPPRSLWKQTSFMLSPQPQVNTQTQVILYTYCFIFIYCSDTPSILSLICLQATTHGGILWPGPGSSSHCVTWLADMEKKWSSSTSWHEWTTRWQWSSSLAQIHQAFMQRNKSHALCQCWPKRCIFLLDVISAAEERLEDVFEVVFVNYFSLHFMSDFCESSCDTNFSFHKRGNLRFFLCEVGYSSQLKGIIFLFNLCRKTILHCL